MKEAMIEQFKNIRPDLGVTQFKDPDLNLEPPLFLMIQKYYEQVFEEQEAKRLAEQYIDKWSQESFKETFW